MSTCQNLRVMKMYMYKRSWQGMLLVSASNNNWSPKSHQGCAQGTQFQGQYCHRCHHDKFDLISSKYDKRSSVRKVSGEKKHLEIDCKGLEKEATRSIFRKYWSTPRHFLFKAKLALTPPFWISLNTPPYTCFHPCSSNIWYLGLFAVCSWLCW